MTSDTRLSDYWTTELICEYVAAWRKQHGCVEDPAGFWINSETASGPVGRWERHDQEVGDRRDLDS